MKALAALDEHMQETVVISRKEALMTTLQSEHVWETVLAQQMQEKPLLVISAIKSGKTFNLKSSIWLRTIVLDDCIRINRQRELLKNRPLKEQVDHVPQASLRIKGLPRTAHVEISEELMRKVYAAAYRESLRTLAQRVNGCGVRVGVMSLVVEVLSTHPGVSAATRGRRGVGVSSASKGRQSIFIGIGIV